jgi:transposase-like protein
MISTSGHLISKFPEVRFHRTRIFTDDSLLKMLYLATMDITKKWTGHRQDWGQIHSQLEIYFEERLAGRNL